MLKDCVMWWATFVAICLCGGYGMWIFHKTKKKGFGPYNISTLLILIVVILSALLLISNKLTSAVVANILLTTIGFAGGLFAAYKSGNGNTSKSQ